MKTQLRNEGGRYSKHSDWYDAIAEARIAELEAQAAAATLAEVVGQAVTALPEAASRIARAATLVQHHEVWPLTSGSFLVGSQSDSTAAHLVRRAGWTCDCKHRQYRDSLCSHALAAMITVKMGTDYHPNYDTQVAA
jgi:hypothetical protein